MPLAAARVKPRLPRAYLSFDGVDDYVDCGSDASLAVTDEITVCVYAKLDVDPAHQIMLTTRDTNWRNGYELGFSLGNLRFLRSNATSVDDIGKIVTWNAKEFHFYTGKYDGSYLYLYVDGEEVGKKSATISSISPALPLIVGTNPMKSDPYWWDGVIAVVYIYNRSLSDSEIQYNYLHPLSPVKDGLVLWLDETSISPPTWADKSGCGNHGTIYGATKVERPYSAVRVNPTARVLAVVR